MGVGDIPRWSDDLDGRPLVQARLVGQTGITPGGRTQLANVATSSMSEPVCLPIIEQVLSGHTALLLVSKATRVAYGNELFAPVQSFQHVVVFKDQRIAASTTTGVISTALCNDRSLVQASSRAVPTT